MTAPDPASSGSLMARFERHEATVGVIGLGYVGLPLVLAFCARGFRVIGFDIDEEKIVKLRRGESYIAHIDSREIARCVEGGMLDPSGDFGRLSEPDAVLICVPTPLTPQFTPDTSCLERSARQIAAVLRPGQLVVLESTTYPGTTRDLIRPILEQKGLRAGTDFHLAYSPEREDPGNAEHTVTRIPKVVGGESPESTRLAAALYRQVAPAVVEVSSSAVAEAAKVLENTYRSVNIALVNELKVLFDRMGIDVWEVIAAASTKPFGFHPFHPGPGVGGHCIPVDPFYLSWKAKEAGAPTRFIELAGEVNASMPRYVVDRLSGALNERGRPLRGAKVLLLGISYKEDIDDLRESPALQVLKLLAAQGAEVAYHDPHIPEAVSRRHGIRMASVPLDAEVLAAQDAVVILAAHRVIDYASVVRCSRLVIDTRNATRGIDEGRDKIVRA